MNCLVADDQTDQVSSVGELCVSTPVHGSVEARVEQEGLKHGRSDLALLGIVALVVGLHDLCLALQGLVLVRPAEGFVNLFSRKQRRENRRVGLRVHRLHEGDIRVNGLFVGSASIGDQRDRTNGSLKGVKQGQTREDTVRHALFFGVQSLPRSQVVAQGHLFGKPEITGETIPDLKVLLVLNAVPVNRFKSGRYAHASS